MATKVAAIEKLDLRTLHKALYSPSAKSVEVVEVPDLLFTMLDGSIEAGMLPGDSADFGRAMEALYGVGYGLKFMSKLRERDPLDFTVMAAEGLWSTESGEFELDAGETYLYTLMMLQPDHITTEMFKEAVAQADEKRPNPALGGMRLERWREGLSIQIMHVGPYADEQRTIEQLDDFAIENGYRLSGRHHEIYLGDPRRAKPENLRTILRYPVDVEE